MALSVVDTAMKTHGHVNNLLVTTVATFVGDQGIHHRIFCLMAHFHKTCYQHFKAKPTHISPPACIIVTMHTFFNKN